MPNRIAYLNGSFVPEHEARVSFYDAGVLWGEMAFESTRTFGGRPFELGHHLRRLDRSLRSLGIDCGLSLAEIERITLETLELNKATETEDMEWQILHNISSGPGGEYRVAFADEELRPTVCIQCFPLIARLAKFANLYETGVQLVIPEQHAMPPDLKNPHVKTRSRLHTQLAIQQANAIEPGAWPLLCTADGLVTEGPSWNVFMVRDGELLTPSTRLVLDGVSRFHTLRLAKEIGLTTHETELTIENFHEADEIFCTATSFCLLYGTTFQQCAIGDGRPGPVYRRLQTAWKSFVDVDFVAQAHNFANRRKEWLEREATAGRVRADH
ncbi:aminotransferase class IV [Thalassoroseus pseudoceratinae]|uniref:aminotransferase class IV n=1 Tax=Thalassoroseus pseudoceratinae TaxID=2713176 RepID=UPI00141F27BB|nr:aminotransferase class IV [Thalassoroseus pseudoceratinae]